MHLTLSSRRPALQRLSHWCVALSLAALACGGAVESSETGDAAPLGAADVPAAPDVSPGDAPALPDAATPPDAPPACTPDCPFTRCSQDDGCGGRCAECPRDANCTDCVLQLHVAELTRDASGLPKLLTLALDYVPPEGAVFPTLADLRIRVVGDATLLEVAAGPAVLDAGKTLQTDPGTGEPYQLLGDGVIRTVVLSSRDDTRIGPGRWLTWRFRLGGAFEPMSGPALFTVVHDEPLLAPPPADGLVGDPAILDPVSIWPLPKGSAGGGS